MTTKEQFIEMAKGITRPGIDQMMAWLETTDFLHCTCKYQVSWG